MSASRDDVEPQSANTKTVGIWHVIRIRTRVRVHIFRDLPVAAAMARGIERSLVHGDVMLAKWATRLNYVTLSEVQQHVPSGFERGTYKITFRGEDLHSANGRCVIKH